MGQRAVALSAASIVAALTLSLLIAACGSSGSGGSSGSSGTGSSQKTVVVGVPSVLSGPLAEIGQGATRGIQLAIEKLNSEGGVLGAKVQMVSRDDKAEVPDAINITRTMLQSEHAVAILGSSSSATAEAEEQLASQSHVPLLLWGGNDEALTKEKHQFLFQLEPTSYMEPRAIAQYLAKAGYKKYYFVAYDISQGHDTVKSLKSSMSSLGAPISDVGESFTEFFQSDYRSVVNAAIAAHPEVVFTDLFGGDQLNFVKQAKSFGLLASAKVIGPSGTDTLFALKGQTPAGLMLADRAYFPELAGPEATEVAEKYHAKFNEWPNEWAMLGYSSVQTWADGVKQAGTFEGTKVADKLSGAMVQTVRGSFKIRSCDNQAEVPEYIGTVAAHVDPKYGFPLLEHVFVSNPAQTLPACP